MPDRVKLLGQTFRDPTKLVNGVARHLLLTREDEDRNPFALHPSELSHKDFCPRAAYYRIAGVSESNPVGRSLAMEMAFETGHDAHRKWQYWLWDMGILRGVFECLYCHLVFEDVSPQQCPSCEGGRDLLIYREVPLIDLEHLIYGNADGDVWVLKEDGSGEWILIEIKTIGARTVEIEAPKLLKRYTYNHVDEQGNLHPFIDWRALWNGIKYPFPSHLRQGMIYCFCKGRKKIRFIYDPKFLTAWPKEFEVKFRKDLIEDVLDECLVVKAALERGKPPRRPMWAEETHAICARCMYKDECYGSRRDREDESSIDSGEGFFAEEEPAPTKKAKVRYTSAPL